MMLVGGLWWRVAAVPDCGEAVWTTEGLWVTNARMEYDTETRKDDCFDRERRPRVI